MSVWWLVPPRLSHPAAQGSHVCWEGFSLLLHKLFPEINQQLLTAVLRGGTHCLSAPTTCRGLHGKCTLSVLVPTHKCAGAPHAKHWSRPAGCTLMHTHANMAQEQLCTHVHAGTQRMCVQTYLHASSYTAAGSGKHIHEYMHTNVQECLQSHECCMHAQVLAFQHICEQIRSYICTATCTHLSALAHICMHTLCTSTCAHMLAHCTSIYISMYTLICACISHAQALAHVHTHTPKHMPCCRC